jgi:membrane peptidoglycan carboxypeptidase
VLEVRRGKDVLPDEGSGATAEPKRVIRPETAATLRQLMEGVVLDGTGPLARLDGWTAAGKTGSAQKIDPATGRYSRTNFVASFTGFAPVSNPAVTILVSIDSPVGLHEGGSVAAPVFKRIAEQVLPYLEIPRDVPLNPRLIQAAYKRQGATDDLALEDFTATDFTGPQDEELPVESKSHETVPKESKARVPEVMMPAEEGGDITVPDFAGKTMRDVTEMCLHLGLEPVLVGSNLATEQMPVAGTKVKHGAKVAIQFGTPAPQKSVKARKRSRN